MSGKRLVRILAGDVWIDPAEVIAVHPNPDHPAGCTIQLSNGASLGLIDVTVATAVKEMTR